MGKDGGILFFVFDDFHPVKRGKKGQDMKLDFLGNIFQRFQITNIIGHSRLPFTIVFWEKVGKEKSEKVFKN